MKIHNCAWSGGRVPQDRQIAASTAIIVSGGNGSQAGALALACRDMRRRGRGLDHRQRFVRVCHHHWVDAALNVVLESIDLVTAFRGEAINGTASV